jgi:hypothetical protein
MLGGFMVPDFSSLPVPFFKIKQDSMIVEQSLLATEQFPHVIYFHDLIDEGSKEKIKTLLNGPYPNRVELNMTTNTQPFMLFDLYIAKAEETIDIVCISKEDTSNQALVQLHKIREQLEALDFQSLDIRLVEELFPLATDQSLTDLNRLSIYNYSGSFKEIPAKLEAIEGLLSILKPELIEIGKHEYTDHISKELDDIKGIVYYALALTPPSK